MITITASIVIAFFIIAFILTYPDEFFALLVKVLYWGFLIGCALLAKAVFK